MRQNVHIRQAAVLGAGVMGAQIAAHLINAGIPTYLFDLAADGKDPNANVKLAIKNLQKLKPMPLGVNALATYIEPANFSDDIIQLNNCDLIIEAVTEKSEIKLKVYETIAPHINSHAILASNTSGLSIQSLAESLSEELKPRFIGVHFFNPPRYMRLVELIPHATTDSKLLDELETFLVSQLGKGVVHGKDTPNFIANRVGVFSMLATLYHAQQYDIPLEIVDALTGPLIGRPKSATFRTADVVGLDTLKHVVTTMQDNLAEDPWHAYYSLPEWMNELITQGALGQKSGAGIYKKQNKEILIFDIANKDYRPVMAKPAEEIIEILKIKSVELRFKALKNSKHPQGQFVCSIFRDLFHYISFHLDIIAKSVRDIDLALRWGFAWKQGPFETWQAAGWQTIQDWIREAIDTEKTMANVAMPEWVSAQTEVYQDNKAYSPSEKTFLPPPELSVYQRQLFPETGFNQQNDLGSTVYENDSLRAWHQDDDILIVSFKTKMNTVDDLVLDGIQASIKLAEQDFCGLILWQNRGQDFSAGANLQSLLNNIKEEGATRVENTIADFQQTAMALRYSQIPTVAAIQGRALGGGCEFPLHCDKIVSAFETYIGLVEIGVGLLPAGGGTKEMARRAAVNYSDPLDLNNIGKYFMLIAQAQVATSAIDAKQKKLFNESDVVIFNPYELLYVAKQNIISLWESNYKPPLPYKFKAAGKTGIAYFKNLLVNYREGGFISDYDYFLATKIAEVFCGGYIEAGSIIDEQWILKLERQAFIELLAEEKTQARIEHILKTGKPLRN